MNDDKYIILDLDNCISDDQWRIPFINWHMQDITRRYHDYHSLCGFDELCNRHVCRPIYKTLDDIIKPVQKIIFTARPNSVRAQTVIWLERKRVAFTHLLMRNDGEHMPSVDTKSQQLANLLFHYNIKKEQIQMAYDDRQDVVDMYKEFGIPSKVLRIHDVCAYKKPGA